MMKKAAMVLLMFASISMFAGMKVGYADFTARSSCPKFGEMASHGYTVAIYAFCVVNGTSVTIPQTYLGQYSSLSEMTADMKKAKTDYPGFKVFLSVGGEAALSSWKPGTASATDVGNAMAKFASDNSFDGVDFDIETEVKPTYMKEVIDQISTAYPKLYISIAPQSVGALGSEIDGAWDNYSKAGFVTGGWCYGYNDAIASGKVNFIWPQMYNNVWCKLNGRQETSVDYIKQFKTIKFNVNIPANTLLLPGIPATKSSGNGVTGVETDTNIKSALSLFPGTMTWSINADATNNWNMVTNVMP